MTEQSIVERLREVSEFLDGSRPLDGVYFGCRHPNRRGEYWWRSSVGDTLHEASERLTANAEAAPTQTGDMVEALRQIQFEATGHAGQSDRQIVAAVHHLSTAAIHAHTSGPIAALSALPVHSPDEVEHPQENGGPRP